VKKRKTGKPGEGTKAAYTDCDRGGDQGFGKQECGTVFLKIAPVILGLADVPATKKKGM